MREFPRSPHLRRLQASGGGSTSHRSSVINMQPYRNSKQKRIPMSESINEQSPREFVIMDDIARSYRDDRANAKKFLGLLEDKIEQVFEMDFEK